MPDTERLRLSVVIPATNAPPTLARCVAAVHASTDPPDEVVVVEEADGPGPAAARNDGLARATGDVVVFVDADVLVRPDALGHLRARFSEDPALVAVFGSYDDDVPRDNIVSGFRNLLHHTIHHRHPGPAETFWAGVGAVRRDAALAAGGFDARRYPRPSIEDVELGGRLARFGTILLDPAIQGTHLKRWTLRSMVETDFLHRGVPWVRLLAEERSVPTTLNLGHRERLSTLAALGAAAGLLTRRPLLTVGCLGSLAALNRDLLAVLRRRLGVRGAVVGVVLHAVHLLVAAAAVPAGLMAHLSRRRDGRAGVAPRRPTGDA